MATGFPDWMRAMALLGKYGTAYKVIAVDEDGNLNIYIRGEDDEGLFHVVAVDGDGQIIMVPRGESGHYMAVDAAGNLAAVMKGDKGLGVLRPVKVDDDGQIIMVPRGQSGYYMAVDAAGNMAAIMLGDKGLGVLKAVKVDDDGQMIMVPRGQSGFYLDVDAAGFLSTILKGWDGAAYRPVKVDTDGKLNAFIYDTQDAWGQISTVGLSEMAARMGSVVRYERSGQIHWVETFENGMQSWVKFLPLPASIAEISPVYSQSGGYSCRLVGAPTGSGTASITRFCGVNPVGKIGLSFSFAVDSDFETIKLSFYLRTTGVQHQPILRLPPPLGKIDIFTSESGWVEVCDLTMGTKSAEIWNTVKLVVDFSTGAYVSLRYNAGTHDISAYHYTTASNSYTPEISVGIQAQSRAGEADEVYIDDVILTFAEP